MSPQPAAFRHPHFRPGTIRRPAVVLQVALDPTGLPREGASSPRERSTIPDAFEVAFLEGLNAEAILPVDVTRSPQSASRDPATAFERFDRRGTLERARTLKADVVLLLVAHLSGRTMVYCEAERRPFVAHTTLWTLGAEVLRAADGTPLLVEPPGPTLRLGDVEPDCERGRIGRRLSGQELLDRAVQRGLRLLLGR